MEEEIEKIKKILEEELNSSIRLRQEINKDLADLRISHIREQRGFFMHLTILSGAILGFRIFSESSNSYYFWTGFSFILGLILFTIFYMREILDSEGDGLQKQQDMFNTIFDQRINIILKYIQENNINKDKLAEFLKESSRLSGLVELEQENKKLYEEREKRKLCKAPLDFSGEFTLFLFVLGSFFIAISLFEYKFPSILLASLIILIFCLTFTNWAIKLTKFISVIISFLKKNINRI